jgi:pseudouridine kinase
MIRFPDPDRPVLVIGAAGIDIVGRAAAPLKPATSNPGYLRLSHGGVARNVAENLVHLGTDTILMTAVGDDPQGQQLLDRVEAEGVDISPSIIDPERQTGAYLAVLGSEGNLAYGLDDMGVIGAITAEAVQAQSGLFEQASVLVLDCNLPPDTLAAAFDLAEASNLPVAIDPTSSTLAHRVQPHLDGIWLLSPNEPEAEELCPMQIPHADEARAIEAARHLTGLGIDMVMITRAEFGVGYATSEGSGHVPAVKTEISDPTGAGDALLATVIFALMNEIPPDESVRLGVTAASLTLRSHDSVVPNLSLEMLYDQFI